MRPYSVTTSELVGAAMGAYPGIAEASVTARTVAHAVIALIPPGSVTDVTHRDVKLGEYLASGSEGPFTVSSIKRSALGDASIGTRTAKRAEIAMDRLWPVIQTDDEKNVVQPDNPRDGAAEDDEEAENEELRALFYGVREAGAWPKPEPKPPVDPVVAAAKENRDIRQNAAAAADIAKYHRKMKRHNVGRHVGAWLMLGLVGGGAFLLHTHDHNVSTTSVVNSSKKVEIPYDVTDSVSVTAGTLNRTANGYRVPPSTVETDQEALEPEMAKANRLKYRLRWVRITANSSEAPVNGDNFYELPASGKYTTAEEADLQSEDTVASTRAKDAELGLINAAEGKVNIPAGSVDLSSEMVPPTSEQLQEIDALSRADGKSVASLVSDFERNPKSVKQNVRTLLTQILSQNQGFTAKFSFIAEKLGYAKHIVHGHKIVHGQLDLAPLKVMNTALVGFFGALIGFTYSTPHVARRVQRSAQHRVHKYQKKPTPES